MAGEAVKCEKCGHEARIASRRLGFNTVRLPPDGTPVRVPEAVTIMVDCPQCGRYTQFEICTIPPIMWTVRELPEKAR
jgi:hypothetical protein